MESHDKTSGSFSRKPDGKHPQDELMELGETADEFPESTVEQETDSGSVVPDNESNASAGRIPTAFGRDPAVSTNDSNPPQLPEVESHSASEAIAGDRAVSQVDNQVGAIPDFANDLQSERIENQRVKEANDQRLKLLMDKVIWASCGICLVVIVVVLISKSGGCNRTAEDSLGIDPSTPSKSSSTPKIESKKIKSQGSSITLQKDSGSKKNAGAKKDNKKSGSSSNKEIDETICYLDFTTKTAKNDFVTGLAPVRLLETAWRKQGEGGCLELSDKSRVSIQRPELFDRVVKLTALGNVQLKSTSDEAALFSIRDKLILKCQSSQLVLMFDGKPVELQGQDSNGKTTSEQPRLESGRWHSFALISDSAGTRLQLDGKWFQSSTAIPRFGADKVEDVMIGSSDGGRALRLKGKMDNVGFFWRVLEPDEITRLLKQ